MLTKRRLPAILYFGLIVLMLALNWLAFRFFRINYFLWYLKSGPLISLAAGFLAPTWTKLKARTGLVSAHPAVYAGACMQILGVFFLSVSPTGRPKQAPATQVAEIGDTKPMRAFDAILYIPIVIVMCLLAITWVVLVAPLSYFVTLVAGVPARQVLRGNLAITDLQEEAGQVNLVESGQPLRSATPVVSFAQDPFALTQALTALILFVTNLLYGRFG